MDTELWANPQIVKPNHQYRLSGLVKLNKWPEGYPYSIKMVATFTGKDKKPLYPEIIGYDQLMLRVVDPGSFEYPSGYSQLNEKVIEIFARLNQNYLMFRYQ